MRRWSKRITQWIIDHEDHEIGRFYLADTGYSLWLVAELCNSGDCYNPGTILSRDTCAGLPVYWCTEHGHEEELYTE